MQSESADLKSSKILCQMSPTKSSLQVPFGLRDERMWEPDQVELGLACGCVCPGCGDRLVAKNGGSKKVHHFAHERNSDCATGAECALHFAAKQLIDERKEIYLPQVVFQHRYTLDHPFLPVTLRFGNLTALTAVSLERQISLLRPDVIATALDGEQVLIEVAVTHFVDPIKKERAIALGLAMVEFDLSDLHRSDFASLSRRLFEPSNHAIWIFHPDVAREEHKLHLREQTEFAARRKAEESRVLDEARTLAVESAERRIASANELTERHALAEKKRLARAKKRMQIDAFRKMLWQEKEHQILEALGLPRQQVPWFLQTEVKGSESFGVPPLVWQTGVFAALIRTAWRRNADKLLPKDVLDWIAARFEITEEFPNASVVAVREWMTVLVEVGVLHEMFGGPFVVLVGSQNSSLFGLNEIHRAANIRRHLWSERWPSKNESTAAANAFSQAYFCDNVWKRLADSPESERRRIGVGAFVVGHLAVCHVFESSIANRRLLLRFLVCAGFSQVAGT